MKSSRSSCSASAASSSGVFFFRISGFGSSWGCCSTCSSFFFMLYYNCTHEERKKSHKKSTFHILNKIDATKIQQSRKKNVVHCSYFPAKSFNSIILWCLDWESEINEEKKREQKTKFMLTNETTRTITVLLNIILMNWLHFFLSVILVLVCLKQITIFGYYSFPLKCQFI